MNAHPSSAPPAPAAQAPRPREGHAALLPTEPPPWATRALGWLLLLVFLTACLASVLIRFPETVHCSFVVVPDKGTEPLRSPLATSSTVASVAVTEGQFVEAGAELFTLRSEEVRASRLRLETAQQELRGLALRTAKLDELLEGQLKLKDEEQQQVEREIAFRKRHLATNRDFLSRNQKLAAEQLVPEVEMRRHELSVLESEKDLQVAERTLQQVILQRRQIVTDRLRQATDEASERSKLEILIASVTQQRVHSDGDVLRILAPYPGIITSLANQNIGDVVAGGAELCHLARTTPTLRAKLTIPDQGLSRVLVGHPIRFFFDAFPYQRFGVLDGAVLWVSPAAVAGPTAPRFVANASLPQTVFMSPEGPRPVRVGMTGTARVQVGRRTLVEHVFEPLRRLREDLGK